MDEEQSPDDAEELEHHSRSQARHDDGKFRDPKKPHKNLVIVKTKGGYKVTSEDGSKDLSSSDLSKGEAEKRLGQIEYFKSKPKKHPLTTFARSKR